MKKKILLSALSVFGLMIASKTFAQSYNHYTPVARHEERIDFRVINQDKATVNYDLRLVDQKKDELQRDKAFHNRFAYRQDKRDLLQLNSKLASDRNKLDFDMRGAHYGDHDGDRF